MATELVINMSEPREKALILDRIRSLQGMQRVTVAAYRKRRSDRQNRYYHPCFVQPFADYLREQGETTTDDEAHEIFKRQFLCVSKIDHKTGEAFEYVRSTTDLDTVEFNDYLDRCAQWLAGFGIVVPEPSVYRDGK